MKKIFILFMALILINSAGWSQVKIGDNVAPVKGAILDITGTVPGGLLLSHVNITDLGKIPANFTDASVQGQDVVTALAGLIVWNTNTTTGEGVYIWDGDNWKKMETESLPISCVNSTLPAGKLCFLTYNLGADPNMTIAEQMAYTSSGNTDATVYGDLYQWGRHADGHQLRTSQSYPTNNTTAESGPVADANLDANGQVVSGNAAYGKFIKNNVSPYDWRVTQNNNLWGATKTANDPCPTGWRVPTQAEWGSIFAGGTTAGAPGLATANTWVWNSTGTPGYVLYASSDATHTTPLLFLPAAGYRVNNNSAFYGAGTYAYYWSSTVFSTGAYYLNFSSTTVSPGLNGNRAGGNSVRCVAE